MRYVIEGVWSGYTGSQQGVVHRHVTTDEKLVEWVKMHRCISYTDGTALFLSVRACAPRERVREMKGYRSLIEQCYRAGVCSVAALADVEKTGAKP